MSWYCHPGGRFHCDLPGFPGCRAASIQKLKTAAEAEHGVIPRGAVLIRGCIVVILIQRLLPERRQLQPLLDLEEKTGRYFLRKIMSDMKLKGDKLTKFSKYPGDFGCRWHFLRLFSRKKFTKHEMTVQKVTPCTGLSTLHYASRSLFLALADVGLWSARAALTLYAV
eukprot:g5407.t1